LPTVCELDHIFLEKYWGFVSASEMRD
jgi:hypothetical protein